MWLLLGQGRTPRSLRGPMWICVTIAPATPPRQGAALLMTQASGSASTLGSKMLKKCTLCHYIFVCTILLNMFHGSFTESHETLVSIQGIRSHF